MTSSLLPTFLLLMGLATYVDAVYTCVAPSGKLGCEYPGGCLEYGEFIDVSPCRRKLCLAEKGIPYLSDPFATGCLDNGTCHQVNGDDWETREKGACVTKSCTKEGNTIKTNFVEIHCEITCANGTKICLADKKTYDTGCEDITCQVFRHDDRTASVRQAISRRGCLDEENRCVPFNQVYVDRSKRVCRTIRCQAPIPITIGYACKSPTGECIPIGNTLYGEYMDDGQCRSRQCKRHPIFKAISYDMGEACDYGNEGCHAPGESFQSVNAMGCYSNGCKFWYYYGAPLSEKTNELNQCSDDDEKCYNVPTNGLRKTINGRVINDVRCSWMDASRTSIRYRKRRR